MKTMSLNMSSKSKIARDVSDPEQRHLLISAQIRNGLPLQLRAMREDRGWTQTKLAERLGTTQNTVSRLENPKTSKPTITTLKRIAEVFDVALIVKFAPFSEFVDSVGGMSIKSVAVPSYDDESREKLKKKSSTAAFAFGDTIETQINKAVGRKSNLLVMASSQENTLGLNDVVFGGVSYYMDAPSDAEVA